MKLMFLGCGAADYDWSHYGEGFRKMRKHYIENGKNLQKTMEYLR